MGCHNYTRTRRGCDAVMVIEWRLRRKVAAVMFRPPKAESTRNGLPIIKRSPGDRRRIATRARVSKRGDWGKIVVRKCRTRMSNERPPSLREQVGFPSVRGVRTERGSLLRSNERPEAVVLCEAPKECRNPNDQLFRISCFVILSSFGFRHSPL